MAVFRYAVLRMGDEWKIVTGGARIGHFRTRQLALQAGARLAREASLLGHEVELLVQDERGGLLPHDVLHTAGHFDEVQGATPSPADEGPSQPGVRWLEV
jgi:hypothetical protein